MNEIVTKVFRYKGSLFAIPFQFCIDANGERELVAFAQDIGKVFYNSTDERESARKINKIATENPDLFIGLRGEHYRCASDGKRYKSYAYTKKGVMALGMKVRSEIGTQFVLWAADIMVALLEGKTVSLQEETPPVAIDPLDLIIQQAQQSKAIKEDLKRQSAEIRELTDEVRELRGRERKTIRYGESNCKSVARQIAWFSKSGKLHSGAISQIVKDRGFVKRGLARVGEQFIENGSGHWVPALFLTSEGVEAFIREIDQAYSGLSKFSVPLSSGDKMHIYRKPATTEAA